jgi:hypothetical protein
LLRDENMPISLDKRGYMHAVNAQPSERLISKLRGLGWRPGQTVYLDRANLEMKFFNSKQELHDYLYKRNRGVYEDERMLDSVADIELKLDQFEGAI